MLMHKYAYDDFSFLTTRLLVTCPSDKNSMGGLFYLDLGSNTALRLFDADCRGLKRMSQGGFLLATNSHGVLQLDEAFNIVRSHPLHGLDLHGLFIAPDGLVYLVETSRNAVGIYRMDTFERVDEIKVSSFEDDQNHINDLWVTEDRLYLSMFSQQGGWRQQEENFDGVIAEYDIRSKQLTRVVQSGLQLPHSVTMIGDQIYYCESLRLNLAREGNVLSQFGGYTRGLAFDGRFFYVGQSEMRHLNRILMRLPNVSIDCGLHLFDSEKRVNRFLPLPAKQVYEVLILEDDSALKLPSEIDVTLAEKGRYLIDADDWHSDEPHQRWMASKRAGVRLEKPESAMALLIHAVSGFPGVYGGTVSVGGQHFGEIEFADAGHQTFEFDVSALHPGIVDVLIELPHLWTPADVLGGDDRRELGLGIKKIEFK